MSFKLGQKFESYEHLSKYLIEYETRVKQKYWKRSSRTIKMCNLKKKFNKNIIYYEVHYSCVYSGKYKTRGKGIRKSRSQRMDCPAFIKLRADETGQVLEVRSVNENHQYHDYSLFQNYYDHLHNKKEIKNSRTCLESAENKEREQQQTVDETETRTLLKDLANIQPEQRKSENWLTVFKIIQETYGGNVSVLEQDNVFQGMFFTTEYMRKNMREWPEFLAVDGTYKLLKDGYTVHIFLTEDSNGEFRITGVGVLASEAQVTFTWLFQCFKHHNPSWTETKCLMTDMDLRGRAVFRAEFPGIPTYLPLYYTLKTFRKEITTEKFHLVRETRELSLQYLWKLASSENEEEYNKLYEEFPKIVSNSVVQYFNYNWQPIRNEWLPYLMVEYYKSNTHSRLETISNKIKHVVEKHSSFLEFVQSFFIWLDTQEQERTHSIAKHILTLPTGKFPRFSPELKYQKFLTGFGFNFVLKHLDLSKHVTNLTKLNDETFLVKSSAGYIEATNENCNCPDGRFMGLPCRHIFAVRRTLDEDLFSEVLCNDRWTRSYYISLATPPEAEDSARSKSSFSLVEKRKNARELAKELATLISSSADDIYENRISVLKNIIESWKQGSEVTVTRNIQENNSESSGNIDENTIMLDTIKTERRDSENSSEYILPTTSQENILNPNNEIDSMEKSETPNYDIKIETFELPVSPVSRDTEIYSIRDLKEPAENHL